MEKEAEPKVFRDLMAEWIQTMSSEELMAVYERSARTFNLVREEVKRRKLFNDQPKPWTGHTE